MPLLGDGGDEDILFEALGPDDQKQVIVCLSKHACMGGASNHVCVCV